MAAKVIYPCTNSRDRAMSTGNEQVVVDFFEAFERLDLDAALNYLTEDCVHDDKPQGMRAGKNEIRNFFASQMHELSAMTADLKELLCIGDIVILERVDQIELKNGKSASLSSMSAFEIRDGKISVWRNYYDRSTFLRQL